MHYTFGREEMFPCAKNSGTNEQSTRTVKYSRQPNRIKAQAQSGSVAVANKY